MGVFGFLGIISRRVLGTKNPAMINKTAIVRQACFLGLAIVIGLILQSYRIFNTVTATLLILSLGILELYFSNQ